MTPDVILPGYLVNSDDFNDHPPPYKFVRRGGRWGSCFANTYRSGGQFLLFLKKTKTGEFTVNWYALGPVNEQLHSDQDAWLIWVREQTRKPKVAPKPRATGKTITLSEVRLIRADALRRWWLPETQPSR